MSVIKLVLYDSQVKIVDKLVTLGSLSALAITVDSYNLVEISYYAQRLIALSQTKSNVLTAIVDKAKYLPEYDIYLSVPGFSDKTVVSLISELADLHRFATSNKLNAFIGIDLIFNDSGEYKSSGFITKQGNKIARKGVVQSCWNHL